MIDLHMIDSGAHAGNEALQIERVRHPLIEVHVAQPVWGNIAEARRRAYALGSHPFVTWIDDDDVVLDVSWVDRAVEILRGDPDVAAVYPRWRYGGEYPAIETPVHTWHVMLSHRYRHPYAHHMTIMRRDNVAEFFHEVGERVMMRDQDLLLVAAQARFGRLVALPTVAYEWVMRSGSPRQRLEPEATNKWAVEHWQQTVRTHRALQTS